MIDWDICCDELADARRAQVFFAQLQPSKGYRGLHHPDPRDPDYEEPPEIEPDPEDWL